MTARPSGAFCSPPSAWPMAIGITPRIIARAVIKTGRSRVVAASMAAAPARKPSSKRVRAKLVTSTLLAVETPTTMMMPMSAGTLSGVPVSHSENSAPEMATGSPLIATNGRVQDWKFTTITRKTRTAARPRPPINSEYDERISAAWPTSSMRLPGLSRLRKSARIFSRSPVMLPRSRPWALPTTVKVGCFMSRCSAGRPTSHGRCCPRERGCCNSRSKCSTCSNGTASDSRPNWMETVAEHGLCEAEFPHANYADSGLLLRAGDHDPYFRLRGSFRRAADLAAIRHLAKSAERLGRGEELESLPEKGPDDIRCTVAAFNRMQIRLRRFLEDRTRMLAAIGHELRTPITSLRLRTEFISDAETREKFAATLDEMQGMAEAALSFAQSESIAQPPAWWTSTPCWRAAATTRPISVGTWSFRPTGGFPIRAGTALRRAIRNVIENAVRYGEGARVALGSWEQGVEIVVEDDGPGIPEADREKVFNPFVRLKPQETATLAASASAFHRPVHFPRSWRRYYSFRQGTGLRVHLRLPALGEFQASH